jgi:hypothetical protein
MLMFLKQNTNSETTERLLCCKVFPDVVIIMFLSLIIYSATFILLFTS